MWGLKLFLLSEKLWVLRGQGVKEEEEKEEEVGFVARLCPSLSYRGLPCRPSLIRWMLGVPQPVFRFFSRGNCTMCSCRFGVSVAGGEFRVLLGPHLEWEACKCLLFFLTVLIDFFFFGV